MPLRIRGEFIIVGGKLFPYSGSREMKGKKRVLSTFLALAVISVVSCDQIEGLDQGQRQNQEEVGESDAKWKCHLCDDWHSDLPFAYGPTHPDAYFEIPEGERATRVEADRDFCVIDGEHYFVRGRLEIPVVDADKTFAWDVWVSQSEASFQRTMDLLDAEGRESEEPYFGWLSTHLDIYPDTTNLKTHVHTRPVGLVPTIELEPTDHPLAIEQRNGITLDRVKEIAALILHPQSSP